MSTRTSLLTGGGLLLAGGLGYWYLQTYGCPDWLKNIAPFLCPDGNGNGGTCESHTSQLACLGAGCFWYNNSCHTLPESHPCSHLLPGSNPGYGYPIGWQACDPISNALCEWGGNTWGLIQENNPDCIAGNDYRKCYVSTETNYTTCGLHPGTDPDECKSHGENCPCGVGNCQPNYVCCDDNICRATAFGETLYGDSSNMICDDSDPGNHFCTYSFIENLGRPLAATTLLIDLDYIWGPFPGSFGTFRIWSWYDGVRTLLYENTAVWLTQSGTLTPEIPIFHECIDALQFNLAALGTNIHIDTFIGHIDY